jgi:hypothetical protein
MLGRAARKVNAPQNDTRRKTPFRLWPRFPGTGIALPGTSSSLAIFVMPTATAFRKTAAGVTVTAKYLVDELSRRLRASRKRGYYRCAPSPNGVGAQLQLWRGPGRGVGAELKSFVRSGLTRPGGKRKTFLTKKAAPG